MLLGAASALFANDGGADLAIVMAMLVALRWPAATLAYVMAAGFIADRKPAAGGVQPGEHLSADYFGIGFAQYASVMLPVNLVAVAASLAVLMGFYRREIPVR